MAYLRPPLFVRRVFNPLAMKFGISGSVTLSVAGRKTGKTQRVPLIPVDHAGDRYLVCPRGETDWVQNLRAAGTAELVHKGKAEKFQAVEVPVEERQPIIDVYRKKAGKAVEGLFRKLPEPADHPVFKLGSKP
jgi:deazaflavin-dependent oxidoreductase (nitroreductase family)